MSILLSNTDIFSEAVLVAPTVHSSDLHVSANTHQYLDMSHMCLDLCPDILVSSIALHIYSFMFI